jgi:hypothetical protein
MRMPRLTVAADRFDQYHDKLREEVSKYFDSVVEEY